MSEPGSQTPRLTCEKCNQSPALYYSPSLNLLFCSTCSSSTSTTSSSSSSSLLEANQVFEYRIACTEKHNQGKPTSSSSPSSSSSLSHYCRTCHRFLCSQCLPTSSSSSSSFPNNLHQHHSIVSIQEEYTNQLNALKQSFLHATGCTSSTFLSTILSQKKQYLLEEFHTLSLVQKNIQQQYRGNEQMEKEQNRKIEERLKKHLNLNLTKIQNEIDRLKAEASEIDEFIALTGLIPSSSSPSSFSSSSPSSSLLLSSSPSQQCLFLKNFQKWMGEASHLSLVHAAQNIQTPSSSPLILSPLPHESRTLHESLSRFPQLISLLKVKKELIAFVMAARKGLLQNQAVHGENLKKLYASSQFEMEHWMVLSEELKKELIIMEKNTKKQICVFCGMGLTTKIASKPCERNYPSHHQQQQQSSVYPSHSGFEGQERREGDGLHYFVPAAV